MINKMVFFIILFSFAVTVLYGNEYEWYTQSFPWVGEEGQDPEVVFADLIEQDKLVSVIFEGFSAFWYDECSCGWINDIGKIRNDCVYKIKVRKDVIPKRIFKKTEIQPYREPTVIIVDINGGGDYLTIQEGIDAATNGDTVLVYPGTYIENINYNGKNITLASLYLTTQNSSYIDSTKIDGNQNGSVVTFESGEDSTAVLYGFTIQNGSGTYYSHNYHGGGILCISSNPSINNCIIENNSAEQGGGICCVSSNIILAGVIIKNNNAEYGGGGIFLANNSTASFNAYERCNIFLNYGSNSCDLRSVNCDIIDIVVDTFTVLEPDNYFAYPVDYFTFDILNYKIEPVNQDLYVNPDGDNSNSGLTPQEPLKNISYALTKIVSDSTYPNNIHLTNGIYSPSLTEEIFPLNCRNYVSIIGEDDEYTILDGNSLSGIIACVFGDNHFSIENLTIKNGSASIGGGIRFSSNSSATIKNVIIKDNIANAGSGVLCNNNCSPIFENVTIKNNLAESTESGVSLSNNCNPVFINSKITGNYTTFPDAISGICCKVESNPIFINTEIVNNITEAISGLATYSGYSNFCDPILINCTICNNSDATDGTINQLDNTNVTLINCILRNYSDDEIFFSTSGDPDTVTISYTNIEDSIYGINTNNNGTIHWLEGNIDSLPQFVGGDPFSYELLPGSPCIDAGTPDTTGLNLPPYDLAGNPRIYNGRIDIGAYEWQGQGIDKPDTSFINKLYLFQNKPNPFSSSTTITFISADYERLKDYKLSIYNARGQLIKTYNGKKDNFWVKTDIVWDGTDENGNKVSPGVYFYKLSYGENSVARKMIFLR